MGYKECGVERQQCGNTRDSEQMSLSFTSASSDFLCERLREEEKGIGPDLNGNVHISIWRPVSQGSWGLCSFQLGRTNDLAARYRPDGKSTGRYRAQDRNSSLIFHLPLINLKMSVYVCDRVSALGFFWQLVFVCVCVYISSICGFLFYQQLCIVKINFSTLLHILPGSLFPSKFQKSHLP